MKTYGAYHYEVRVKATHVRGEREHWNTGSNGCWIPGGR